MRIMLLGLVPVILALGPCEVGREIPSLCIIDMEDEMCWVSKEENKGFTLPMLHEWYALNEEDLRKIADRLNECQNPTSQRFDSSSDTTTK